MRHVNVFLLLVLVTGTSLAQPDEDDKRKARAFMDQGQEASWRQDHAAALEKYRAADAIVKVPTTGLAVARSLSALGRLIEARDKALQVRDTPAKAGEPPVFQEARDDAARLAESIGARIATLELVIRGAVDPGDLRISIDGKKLSDAEAALPRELDPGTHRVVIAAKGRPSVEKQVSLGVGARKTLEIQLGDETATAPAGVPAPARVTPPARAAERRKVMVRTADRGTSPLVPIGFGVGAAGLAVGATAGVISLRQASQAEEECSGNVCPPGAEAEIDSSKQWATVSNVGFGVAAAGAIVGLIGLFSSGGSEERSPAARPSRPVRVQPLVGSRFVGVGGKF